MSQLTTNTTTIDELITMANNLPDAGTDLPELTNEGTAADLLSGKELINSEGEKVTGTIATKTASNLTASGATVTVPAGYYASQATKSVATATQATPSVSIDSAGKITATATQTAGYVNAGTKTGTKQLTTQAAKTVTPTKSSQTAVAKNVYTTGVITVAAIPNQYQDITAPLSELNAANGGTAATTISAAVDNTEAHASSQEALIAQIAEALEGKAAAATPVLQVKEITPTASQQIVIPDSRYDGLYKVIVAGDNNLVAENIAEGVSIFGVTGTHAGGSGGGTVETCTITMNGDGIVVGYIDESGMPQVFYNTTTASVCCLKNTLVTAHDGAGMMGINVTGGELVYESFMFDVDIIYATSDINVKTN